jgi:hypothetical protein
MAKTGNLAHKAALAVARLHGLPILSPSAIDEHFLSLGTFSRRGQFDRSKAHLNRDMLCGKGARHRGGPKARNK